MNHPRKDRQTSWNKVSHWYGEIVGSEGHYYHQKTVIPGSLKLLDLKPGEKLLDLACGNGVLSRAVGPKIEYVGIDMAASLIDQAKRLERNKNRKWRVADVGQNLGIEPNFFDKVAIILAIQNIRNLSGVITNASIGLKSGGRLVIVMNHPVFRIPRFSSWGVDTSKKLQYRRIDSYMSNQEVPITMNPGQSKAVKTTWSFHRPIQTYFDELKKSGFVIESLEEWTSDKTSTGGKAKMENRARNEFPLFMAIVARKYNW
jgi:ubiquinone/menaquinone biosynthesis C-methylase UbiE